MMNMTDETNQSRRRTRHSFSSNSLSELIGLQFEGYKLLCPLALSCVTKTNMRA